MVHELKDGTCVISDNGGWLHDVFDSKETAENSLKYKQEDIVILQNKLNEVGSG